ncbi:hypothetical protein ACF3NR_06415 [Vaginella massiliensis]
MKYQKSYESSLIVAPNFKSNEYLYDKIKVLDSKLKIKDIPFIKQLNLQQPEVITEIKIEPIVDIYSFVEYRDDKFKMVELMAEDSNVNKVIEDPNTSTFYDYHKIIIKSNAEISQADLQSIMSYLNDSEYYNKRKVLYIENVKKEIEQHRTSVELINQLLSNANVTTNNNVLVQNNNQLGDVIKYKSNLLIIIQNLSLDLENYSSVVKLVAKNDNYAPQASLLDNKIIVYPIVLVFLFILINSVVKVIRKVS